VNKWSVTTSPGWRWVAKRIRRSLPKLRAT
jgi:hypothetical protein